MNRKRFPFIVLELPPLVTPGPPGHPEGPPYLGGWFDRPPPFVLTAIEFTIPGLFVVMQRQPSRNVGRDKLLSSSHLTHEQQITIWFNRVKRQRIWIFECAGRWMVVSGWSTKTIAIYHHPTDNSGSQVKRVGGSGSHDEHLVVHLDRHALYAIFEAGIYWGHGKGREDGGGWVDGFG